MFVFVCECVCVCLFMDYYTKGLYNKPGNGELLACVCLNKRIHGLRWGPGESLLKLWNSTHIMVFPSQNGVLVKMANVFIRLHEPADWRKKKCIDDLCVSSKSEPKLWFHLLISHVGDASSRNNFEEIREETFVEGKQAFLAVSPPENIDHSCISVLWIHRLGLQPIYITNISRVNPSRQITTIPSSSSSSTIFFFFVLFFLLLFYVVEFSLCL